MAGIGECIGRYSQRSMGGPALCVREGGSCLTYTTKYFSVDEH